MDLSFFDKKTDAERQKLRALRMTRPGYAQERILHNFLLDAYVGGGGFQNGLIPSPDAPFWGRRAYERGRSTWLEARAALLQPPGSRGDPRQASQVDTSYLVAFHGEDENSFLDRIKTSSYANPCEKIVRFTNSLLTQNDPKRENIPSELTAWMRSVDPRRRSMGSLRRNQILRGQLFGWGATLEDAPRFTGGTFADSVRDGLLPYCLLVTPQEIYDYDCAPGGKLTSSKLVFMCEHPRKSLFDLKMWEEHFLLWYEDRWERYVVLIPPAELCAEIYDPELGRIISEQTGPNPTPGTIPLSFFSWDEGLGGLDSYGLPQIFNIAKAAWDNFQIGSELRRLMRDQTFATLVRERPAGGAAGNLPMGTKNYITESQEFKGGTRFLETSGISAQVYETRIEKQNEMLHRMSGVDSGAKAVSETAEAMRIRFQQTEAMLMNAVSNADAWELSVLRQAGRLMGIREEPLMRMSVVGAKTFDVGRFAAQIDESLKLLTIPWGKEAMTQIMQRTLRSAIPNATPQLMAQLDAEVRENVEANYDSFLKAVTSKGPLSAGSQTPAPNQDPAPPSPT